jgi:glycosyltransferase involved in cell wall biosynthesis
VGSDALKVLVKSPFSEYSGYGMDGLGIIRALHQWGCDVYIQPTWVDVPIPRDLLPLFARTLEPPFDLLINHWDPTNLFITREARGMSRIAVAWTMWEFAGGPGKDGKPVTGLVPHCKRRTTLPQRLRWFDMVLGYDQVTMDALDPYVPSKVRSGVLQGGYDSRLWKQTGRDWTGDRFQFIMHGQLNRRKQPWVAIQAFQKLKFEKGSEFEGARLALHTSVPGHIFPELNEPFAKSGSGIKVFADALSKQGLDDFYGAGHVLLAPSMGEGKLLPALEFMTTGGTCAVTNFGGPEHWLSEDYAYPLDYELVPTFEDKPWAAHHAQVDPDYLAEVIWHIWTHRDEARRKAELAADIIPKMCDWQVVIEALFRRLAFIDGPGPEVSEKALASRRKPGDKDGWGFPPTLGELVSHAGQ